jgi:hypothetical protein
VAGDQGFADRVRPLVAGLPATSWWSALNPVQRQLFGGGDANGDHAWGHFPQDTPLYVELRQRGLLDANHPPLIP